MVVCGVGRTLLELFIQQIFQGIEFFKIDNETAQKIYRLRRESLNQLMIENNKKDPRLLTTKSSVYYGNNSLLGYMSDGEESEITASHPTESMEDTQLD